VLGHLRLGVGRQAARRRRTLTHRRGPAAEPRAQQARPDAGWLLHLARALREERAAPERQAHGGAGPAQQRNPQHAVGV
jgi:hypothetical protein